MGSEMCIRDSMCRVCARVRGWPCAQDSSLTSTRCACCVAAATGDVEGVRFDQSGILVGGPAPMASARAQPRSGCLRKLLIAAVPRSRRGDSTHLCCVRKELLPLSVATPTEQPNNNSIEPDVYETTNAPPQTPQTVDKPSRCSHVSYFRWKIAARHCGDVRIAMASCSALDRARLIFCADTAMINRCHSDASSALISLRAGRDNYLDEARDRHRTTRAQAGCAATSGVASLSDDAARCLHSPGSPVFATWRASP